MNRMIKILVITMVFCLFSVNALGVTITRESTINKNIAENSDNKNAFEFVKKLGYGKVLDIKNNWLYYYCGSDKTYGYIGRIGLDGTQNQILVENSYGFTPDADNSVDGYIVITDEKIIYCNVTSLGYISGRPIVKGQIYSMNLDGSEKTALSNEDFFYKFRVHEGWFYMDKYRMKLDGSNKQIVIPISPIEKLDDFIIVDDYIYYEKHEVYIGVSAYHLSYLCRVKVDGTNNSVLETFTPSEKHRRSLMSFDIDANNKISYTTKYIDDSTGQYVDIENHAMNLDGTNKNKSQ